MQDNHETGSPPLEEAKITRKKDFLKKMSKEYEARGLTKVCVDNAQVAALHTENNRERGINESLQTDIVKLREQ